MTDKERYIKEGMERAAMLLDEASGPYDRSPLATMIRTVAAGGHPCEDCGYALPKHDEACVSRNFHRLKDARGVREEGRHD